MGKSEHIDTKSAVFRECEPICPTCGAPCVFRRESLDAMSAHYAGKSSAILSNCCDGELKNPAPEYWDLP